jgi:hypothetical protein
MKIYKVDFKPMFPVGCCLVIAAPDKRTATKIAKDTVKHTEDILVTEVNIEKPCVIEYLSGDY